MPVLILAAAILTGMLFRAVRAHGALTRPREVDRDTKGLQCRAKSALTDLFGTPLQRVDDVRLAAVVPMVQIVRTGRPVTAAEMTRIPEFMATPLEGANG